MKLVDQAAIRPNRCAVIPYMGNTNASGFIDTGMDLDLEHVYISFEAVVEMGRMLGLVGPSVVKGFEARISELEAENDDIKAQLQNAQARVEAIDFLGSNDFIVRHKRGPKKKETPTNVEA